MKIEVNPLVVISAHTGFLMCEFSELREYVQVKIGHELTSDFYVKGAIELCRGAIEGDYRNAVVNLNRRESKMLAFGPDPR